MTLMLELGRHTCDPVHTLTCCGTVLSEVGVDDVPREPKFDSRFADGDG